MWSWLINDHQVFQLDWHMNDFFVFWDQEITLQPNYWINDHQDYTCTWITPHCVTWISLVRMYSLYSHLIHQKLSKYCMLILYLSDWFIMIFDFAASLPFRLNTAISPDVLWLPKWTPDTSKSVSVLLNCENWVYFQVKVRMSYLYLSFTGYLEFHT